MACLKKVPGEHTGCLVGRGGLGQRKHDEVDVGLMHRGRGRVAAKFEIPNLSLMEWPRDMSTSVCLS